MQPLPTPQPNRRDRPRPMGPCERRFPANGGAAAPLSRLTGTLHGVTVALAGSDPLERLGTARGLRAEGATVHVIEDPSGSLSTLSGRLADLDLLITDVRLRDGSGPMLARDLWRARPSLPVLYLCSSTRDTLGYMGGPEDRARLLFRPFDDGALARTIREHLDDVRNTRAPTPFPSSF